MFEKLAVTSNGIPYSRYILSWINVGGWQGSGKEFVKWLKSLDLLESEIEEMRQIFSWWGKLELEESAKKYVKEYKERTLLDAYDSMSDDEKNDLYIMVGKALEVSVRNACNDMLKSRSWLE